MQKILIKFVDNVLTLTTDLDDYDPEGQMVSQPQTEDISIHMEYC